MLAQFQTLVDALRHHARERPYDTGGCQGRRNLNRYRDEQPSRLRKGPIGLQISGASSVEHKDVGIEVDPRDNRLITVKEALLL